MKKSIIFCTFLVIGIIILIPANIAASENEIVDMEMKAPSYEGISKDTCENCGKYFQDPTKYSDEFFIQTIPGVYFNQSGYGLGVYSGLECDGVTQIIFPITISDVDPKTASESDLILRVQDIDYLDGEMNTVSLNGVLLGTLEGNNDEWSTNTFSFNPSLLNSGDNWVTITIDPDWCMKCGWGVISLNKGDIPGNGVTFTGLFDDYRECVEGESYSNLGAAIGVNVQNAGHYIITALLQASDESTVCWGVGSSDFVAGDSKNMVLHFSGNQIYDSQKNGPYTIKNIYVYCEESPSWQGLSLMEYSTHSYRFDEFKDHHCEAFINSTSTDWANVVPTGNLTYSPGSEKIYFNQAKPGANLTDVVVNLTSQGPVDNYLFTNIQGENNITAYGEPKDGQVHAFFDATPRYGPMGLTVSFTDLSLGYPTSWYWDFGDGKNSTEQHSSNVYSLPGLYSVSLRVANAKSSSTGVWTQCVNVTETAVPEPDPVPTPEKIIPDFTGTPSSGTGTLLVTFQDLSTGNPTSWYWDFGDGNASTNQHPEHLYETPGTYSVTLTALNSQYSGSITKNSIIEIV